MPLAFFHKNSHVGWSGTETGFRGKRRTTGRLTSGKVRFQFVKKVTYSATYRPIRVCRVSVILTLRLPN
jgi:hypothetical protein